MKNKRLSVQLREEDLKAAKMSSKNKLRTIEVINLNYKAINH